MFVPYFLFLNVKFNVTVPPIYYHTKIAPRIKGYPDIPQPHMHTQRSQRPNIPGNLLLYTIQYILNRFLT